MSKKTPSHKVQALNRVSEGKRYKDKGLKKGDFKVISFDVSEEKNPKKKAEGVARKGKDLISKLQERGEPRRVHVILKIKKPGQRKPFYITATSGPDKVIKAAYTKKFIAQTVSDYYGQMQKKIKSGKMKGDSSAVVEPYPVIGVSIRYVYHEDK